MKREIIYARGMDETYPSHTFRSRRSKKARARDKKVEHQHARSIHKRRELSMYEADGV